MAETHMEVVRDPRFPDGEPGAWEARVIVDGKEAVSALIECTRDDAIRVAGLKWAQIKDDYLADPTPAVERIPLD